MQVYNLGFNVLRLPVHGQPPHQLDLAQMLGAERQQPVNPTLQCQCLGVAVQVPSVLVPTQGQVLLLHLARNLAGQARRDLTPLARPPANHLEWPGLQARAVVAHTGNHFVAFVMVRGVWWRSDSVRAAPTQEDPWVHQGPLRGGLGGYTVDVVVMSQ